MSDKEAGMPAQSRKPTAKTETPAAIPAPDRSGEDFRKEWADANGVDPKEMYEIHAIGGWVDRFDGAGWVQEGA